MKKIVVFGIGQTAEIVSYYLEKDSLFEIVAYTVDGDHMIEGNYNGKQVVPFETIQEKYPPSEIGMFIAVGYANLNKTRAEKYYAAKDKGYTCVTYISSRAGDIAATSIGENCFIMEHQSIQTFSKIGNNCFLWSGVLVAHHSIIMDHCWLTSEVSIAGNSVIGERCFLGINATIGHMVTLGADCMVGAGSLITKNSKDGSVYIAKSTEPYKLTSEQFLKITNMR